MYRRALSLVLFLVVWCFSCPAYPITDSLKQAVGQLKGVDRLNAIYDLVKAHHVMPEMPRYIDWLEREARKQGDENFIGAAPLLRITYYNETRQGDSLLYWAQRGREYALAHKQEDRYFLIENFVVNHYIAEGKYQLALAHVQEILAKAKALDNWSGELQAYETMGSAYLEAGRPREAVEPLRRGVTLLEDRAPDRAIARIDLYRLLGQAAYDSGDYGASLEYCCTVWDLLQKFERNKPGTQYEGLDMSDYLLSAQTMLALNHIALHDAPAAKAALDSASSYLGVEMFEFYIQQLNLARARYAILTGDYAAAGAYAAQAAAYFREVDMPSAYIESQKVRARALAGGGAWRDAYQVATRASHLSDSLLEQSLARQIDEIHTLHRVEQLAAEKRQAQIRLWWLLSACLLLALMAGGAAVYSRRLTVKNKGLVRRIREQDRLSEELAARDGELTRLRNLLRPADAPAGPDEKEDALFVSLRELMRAESLYTDPDLTRRTVADRLGTNETYLHETIKKHTARTFTEYLNGLRLNHAREMLSDGAEKYTIEAVAIDSGFGSRQTLHRLFKREYDLTPEEFRRLSCL